MVGKAQWLSVIQWLNWLKTMKSSSLLWLSISIQMKMALILTMNQNSHSILSKSSKKLVIQGRAIMYRCFQINSPPGKSFQTLLDRRLWSRNLHVRECFKGCSKKLMKCSRLKYKRINKNTLKERAIQGILSQVPSLHHLQSSLSLSVTETQPL